MKYSRRCTTVLSVLCSLTLPACLYESAVEQGDGGVSPSIDGSSAGGNATGAECQHRRGSPWLGSLAWTERKACVGKRCTLALTFDDGPHPDRTPLIASALKRHQAPAAFFMLGRNAESFSHVVQQHVADGFQLANHTFTHNDSTRMCEATWKDEVRRTKSIIGDRDNRRLYFRFPFGSASEIQLNWLNELAFVEGRYQSIGWHADSFDWAFQSLADADAESVEEVRRDVIELLGLYAGQCDGQANPFVDDYEGWVQFSARQSRGGIYLFHDINRLTADKIETILTHFEDPVAYWASLSADKRDEYRRYYECMGVDQELSFDYDGLPDYGFSPPSFDAQVNVDAGPIGEGDDAGSCGAHDGAVVGSRWLGAAAWTDRLSCNGNRCPLTITFDDGPHPDRTPTILEALKRHSVPATFFLLGRNVESFPQIVDQEAAEGYQLANHTYTHSDSTQMCETNWKDEVSRTKALIGRRDQGRLYFRFPFGSASETQVQWLRDLSFGGNRYRSVGWHADSFDWAFQNMLDADAASALARRQDVINLLELYAGRCGGRDNPFIDHFADWVQFAVRQSRGGIFLLHDINRLTAENMEDMLRHFEDSAAYWTSLPAERRIEFESYYDCMGVQKDLTFDYRPMSDYALNPPSFDAQLSPDAGNEASGPDLSVCVPGDGAIVGSRWQGSRVYGPDPECIGHQCQATLTFDDGPHAVYTPDILNTLAEQDMDAVFFALGRNVVAHDAIIEDIVDAGHQMANHTFRHRDSTALCEQDWKDEVRDTKSAIGTRDDGRLYFRFPFGSASSRQMAWLQQLNFSGDSYVSVGWHADSLDWAFQLVEDAQTPEEKARELADLHSQLTWIAGDCDGQENPFAESYVDWVLFAVRQSGGGIVLFHDIIELTRDHLPEIIRFMKDPTAYWALVDPTRKAAYLRYYACQQVDPNRSFSFVPFSTWTFPDWPPTE